MPVVVAVVYFIRFCWRNRPAKIEMRTLSCRVQVYCSMCCPVPGWSASVPMLMVLDSMASSVRPSKRLGAILNCIVTEPYFTSSHLYVTACAGRGV